MHQFIKILLTVSAFTFVVVRSEWYDNANFYQIYPRSFMDSDGDGVGDLRGIISKLSYLKDLGIDGVWLSPIFKSPMVDFGYDISDYRDIQDEYGTLDDFQHLVGECNRLGIKLILDFVPNHTSSEHDWFKRSERNESDYKDFYIWRNPIVDPISNIATPPNNWLSVFRYSAWRWSDVRQQMYYHAFHRKQVDLNYRNEKVVQEMKNVLTYWLDKGVDGFRIDAVPLIYEKMNGDGTFPDEPRSYQAGCDQNDRCFLQSIYTQDQPETYDMIYQWRKLIDDYSVAKNVDKKVLMVEASARLDLQMLYYGNGSTPGAQIPFNFELMLKLNRNSKAEDYKKLIEEWLTTMPAGQMANWVLGNHDQHRIASRLGEEKGDLFNILLQTLPGAAITYQGEELVMTNVHLTWNETVDPLACNTNPEIYDSVSRDPARSPFPWDDSKNAGFSNGSTTWLPVGDHYKTVNVKAQLSAENSHLKIFKRLVALRKTPLFQNNNYSGELSNNGNVYSYKRQNGNDVALIVLNFGTSEETVDLIKLFPLIPEKLKVYTSSLNSGLQDDAIVDANAVKIKSSHGIVLLNSALMMKINLILLSFASFVSIIRFVF